MRTLITLLLTTCLFAETPKPVGPVKPPPPAAPTAATQDPTRLTLNEIVAMKGVSETIVELEKKLDEAKQLRQALAEDACRQPYRGFSDQRCEISNGRISARPVVAKEEPKK